MHTVVVFHRETRGRVDEALRALSESGIDRDSVLVTPVGEPPPERAPRSVLGLSHRLHYAGIGAALGMLGGLAVAPGGFAPLWAIWFVIVGAVLGGFLGGIVGFVVGGIRRQRWRMRAPHPDVLVRVEAESRDLVERARTVLLAHGGEVYAPA